MPDFTDKLRPAEPSGPSILSKEREQSNVPLKELSEHLLSHDGFLERQARILPILENDPLFSKAKQQNLSRPERYHLGLARGKKLRRLFNQNGWSEEDHAMAAYLCDDVSPYMVHVDMFITTIEEQGNDEQRDHWLPRVNAWEVIGCYAQYVESAVCLWVASNTSQNRAWAWKQCPWDRMRGSLDTQNQRIRHSLSNPHGQQMGKSAPLISAATMLL